MFIMKKSRAMLVTICNSTHNNVLTLELQIRKVIIKSFHQYFINVFSFKGFEMTTVGCSSSKVSTVGQVSPSSPLCVHSGIGRSFPL